MSMLATCWVCRRCLATSIKHARSHQNRFLSSGHGSLAPISAALLNRARSLSIEHTTLADQTTGSFNPKVAKRIGELQPVAAAFKQWEDTSDSLAELNDLLKDPKTDHELRELATEELASTIEHLETLNKDLTTALTPKHPFAESPCFLEIRPGAGGGEANLFANDLLRMYKAYCIRKGLRATVIKLENADGTHDANGDAPIAEAILEIENEGAYENLRSEAGVHRVQRVPATESKGRTHTSAVSVLVLPSIPVGSDETLGKSHYDDPNSDYYINPVDVRTDVMRARGAGGQHVNTTESAVRLTHIPTNTVVSMQDSRSQHKNREKAWNILRSRLAQARREAREEEVQKIRRSVAGVARMGRGDKVRTYNWGQQRVTDHRSGLSVHNLDDVLGGGDELEKIIQSVKTWLADRDIDDLMVEEEVESTSLS